MLSRTGPVERSGPGFLTTPAPERAQVWQRRHIASAPVLHGRQTALPWLSFRGMVAGVLSTLDHVIVAVRDLDAAARDYRRLLGLQPSWAGEHPGAGTTNVSFQLQNTNVELVGIHGSGPMASLLEARLAAHGEGIAGMAFGTDDLETLRSEFEVRGLGPGAIERGSGRDSRSGAQRTWRRVPLPFDRTRGLLLFPIQHDGGPDALPLAVPTASKDACVTALDHVVVQTTDADAARRLFGDGLGIRLAVDKVFESWGVRLQFFRIGGVTLEVASALGADGPRALPDTAGDRLFGMSYRVPSAEAARSRLANAGVDVSEVRAGRRPGTRVFTVRGGACGVPTLMIEFEKDARL